MTRREQTCGGGVFVGSDEHMKNGGGSPPRFMMMLLSAVWSLVFCGRELLLLLVPAPLGDPAAGGLFLLVLVLADRRVASFPPAPYGTRKRTKNRKVEASTCRGQVR